MSPYAKCMAWLGVALVLVAIANAATSAATSAGLRLPLLLVGVPFLTCLVVAGHYGRRID